MSCRLVQNQLVPYGSDQFGHTELSGSVHNWTFLSSNTEIDRSSPITYWAGLFSCSVLVLIAMVVPRFAKGSKLLLILQMNPCLVKPCPSVDFLNKQYEREKLGLPTQVVGELHLLSKESSCT